MVEEGEGGLKKKKKQIFAAVANGPLSLPHTLALGAWRTPRLHCVLAAEKEVMCSWEVNAEVAHFISHQLECRRHPDTA